ncbi:related to ISA1-mitochondrial matrix protein involved in biogenesis of the iron-sulfur cluster of Fe/S proteins [Sporisorium reilianum f. sp. reilianum]|uniref:Related to ISA1-mitochondrial matrix protein involved in biogenesis of the iron-sulfur cluster of Fe/S proteins n=1 Tax=Sporisorium reilianum f. sp. reilianum TaxID=72559 RepID=A0A2N8UKS5_9BASI|nr:related to ISA1-mitochondrial matrix protein involved in biogenesis of the iron-sulfur cluster of Fe/S proteins [Sporisorium reilianum f. sp. reilianum]
MMRSILPTGSARAALRYSQARASTTATRLPGRGMATLLSRTSSRSSSLASTSSSALRLSPLAQSPSVYASQTRLASTLVRKPDEPEEPEVYRDGEPTIIATDRAIAQLKKVAERENNSSLALRVAVEPGGCHGYQYKMEITEEIEDDDFQFEVHPGVSILVDSISLALVRGSTIDYVTELIGSQFAIKNNPQAKGAGCGCGVSWEPAI